MPPRRPRLCAAILSFAEREGKVLLAVDVSAPGAPTARFVGSYQPATGPDPSADVPSRRGRRRARTRHRLTLSVCLTDALASTDLSSQPTIDVESEA